MGAVGATLTFRPCKIFSALRAVPFPYLGFVFQFFKQSLGLFYALYTNPLFGFRPVCGVKGQCFRRLVSTAFAGVLDFSVHFVRKGVEGI